MLQNPVRGFAPVSYWGFHIDPTIASSMHCHNTFQTVPPPLLEQAEPTLRITSAH